MELVQSNRDCHAFVGGTSAVTLGCGPYRGLCKELLCNTLRPMLGTRCRVSGSAANREASPHDSMCQGPTDK